ncbi:MAG: hypothetical protein VX639_02965, partial [Pseudomonadota bacterium]|nr:hypothetical protein [Pseudomonadota bacterium]
MAEIIRRSATHRKGSADKRLVTKNGPDTVAKPAYTAILMTDLTDRQAFELLKSRPWYSLVVFLYRQHRVIAHYGIPLFFS